MARKLIDQSIGNLMRRGAGGGAAKMEQLLLAQFLYYANEELKKHFPKISQNDMRAVSVRGGGHGDGFLPSCGFDSGIACQRKNDFKSLGRENASISRDRLAWTNSQ